MNFRTAAVGLATLILATVAAKAEQKTDLFGFATGDTFQELVSKLKTTPMKGKCNPYYGERVLTCFIDGRQFSFDLTESLTPKKVQAIQYFFAYGLTLDEIIPSLNEQFGSKGKLIRERTSDVEKTYGWALTPDIDMVVNAHGGRVYVLISNKRIEREDKDAQNAARLKANPMPKF